MHVQCAVCKWFTLVTFSMNLWLFCHSIYVCKLACLYMDLSFIFVCYVCVICYNTVIWAVLMLYMLQCIWACTCIEVVE